MSGGDYLAAAYLVVLAVVLAYVLIISLKLIRLERELAELARRAQERRAEKAVAREEARVG
jgi:CcmD family protein